MQKRCRKVLSMPVVSLEDGSHIGKVKGLLVDPAERTVAALVLDQKGLFKEQKVIPFQRVKSVGEHAITVDKSSGAERLSSLPQLAKLAKEPTAVVGAQVITEDGNVLGTVEEYTFDSATGGISTLELAGNLLKLKGRATLPVTAVITLGKSVIIARAGSEVELDREENPLQETVKSVRDTGTRVWDTTRQTTRRWGESLSKSIERFVAEEVNRPPEEAGGGNGAAARPASPDAGDAAAPEGQAGSPEQTGWPKEEKQVQIPPT